MQEAQVTIEGERFPLAPPFLVIATQNPIELEGTYPLPEAQLDRFLLRLAVGYPTATRRWRSSPGGGSAATTRPRSTPSPRATELLAMQASLEDVHVAEGIERYIVDIVRATRSDHRVALGASPRGALALLKLGRALAVAAAPRVRAARRRQGDGGAGARAPPHPASGAVGVAGDGRAGRADLLAQVPAPAADVR